MNANKNTKREEITLSLEQLIIYCLDNKSLLDACEQDPSFRMKFLQTMKIGPYKHVTYQFDTLIQSHILEALISPVDWIRERAELVRRDCK